MNAKKCDRCGKFYENEESAAIKLTNGADNFCRRLWGVNINHNEKTFDLCDDCVEEFQKWMEQGKGQDQEIDDDYANQVVKGANGTE